jgi:hypothetical protein
MKKRGMKWWWRGGGKAETSELEKNSYHQHTVDGDGNDLSEGEAVGTHKGRDLAERVDLGVLSVGAGRVGGGVNQLEVEVVVLGSDQDRDGATVLL